MDHVHAKVIGDNQIMHVSLCKQIFTVGQVFCFTYVDSREAAVQNTYIRYHKGCYYHWAITSTPFHGIGIRIAMTILNCKSRHSHILPPSLYTNT